MEPREKVIGGALGRFAGDAAQQLMERAMAAEKEELHVVEGRK